MLNLLNSPNLLQTSSKFPQMFSSFAKRYPCSPKFWKCSKFPPLFVAKQSPIRWLIATLFANKSPNVYHLITINFISPIISEFDHFSQILFIFGYQTVANKSSVGDKFVTKNSPIFLSPKNSPTSPSARHLMISLLDLHPHISFRSQYDHDTVHCHHCLMFNFQCEVVW